MENQHIVRHVRYSEIDKIPDLTWAEKERLRLMRRTKKRAEDPLSLEGLRQGDNREWGALVEMMTPRLRHHVEQISDERFREDIISEAIINVYISRYIYESVDHMIASLHEFARYEAFGKKWKHNSSRTTLLEGHPSPLLEWASYQNYEEADNLEARIKYEEWKDQMVALITSNAVRLPRKWKIWVFLHLTGASRKQIAHFYKVAHFKAISQHLCHRRLRWVIEWELREKRPDHEQQIADLRALLKKLPQRLADVLKAAMVSKNNRELAVNFGRHTVHTANSMREVIELISTAYYDPFLRYPFTGYKLLAFKSIIDPDFWQAIQEEVIDSSHLRADNWEMRRKVFTNDELREIYLMRQEQNLPWEYIAFKLKTEPAKVRKAYMAAFPDAPAVKKHRTQTWDLTSEQKEEIKRLAGAGVRKIEIAVKFSVSLDLVKKIVADRPVGKMLTMQQAVEIRRLYQTGQWSQKDLGAKFGVAGSVVERIVNNRAYKEIPSSLPEKS